MLTRLIIHPAPNLRRATNQMRQQVPPRQHFRRGNAAGDTGKFIIIDGQHRIEAVRRRPDIGEVPCYVLGDLTQNEQARIFVAVNNDRVSLTSYALFHAQCAAGDQVALKIKEVCEEADITICKYPVPGGMTAPRETQALGTIKRGIEAFGEDNVIATLMIVHHIALRPA
jgi:hypothetical protein